MSKVSDTVQEITVFNGQDTIMVSSKKSRMLTEEILRNSYSVLSIPVAILKLAARNHLLKILHLNYGNGIPAVIARTDYDSNSQTKTINSTFSMTSLEEHEQDIETSEDESTSATPSLQNFRREKSFHEPQAAPAEDESTSATPSL